MLLRGFILISGCSGNHTFNWLSVQEVLVDEKILQELGLGKVETRTYLALLKIGSCSAGGIAKATGIHRRNIYDALNKLTGRALVGFVEKEKKYYAAADPKKLFDILKEKEGMLKSILPELSESYIHPKVRQSVFVYEGREGLKTIFNDIFREGKEWLALGSTGLGKKILGEWIDQFEKRRAKAGIRLKVIFNDTPEGRKRGEELVKIGRTKAKYFPRTYFMPISTYVYGNKASLLLWSEISPISIIIDSREFSQAFRNYFNLIWKIAAN